MTDEVDITAKDLAPVEPRQAEGAAQPLGPSEPTLPPVDPAPVRARNALVLAETSDDLSAVDEAPVGAPTVTLDDEAEALDAHPRPAQAAARPALALALAELTTAPPPGRARRRKTRALVAHDGFEAPSAPTLPKVDPAPAPAPAAARWTPADWLVAGLVALFVASVVLVFCAA